MKTIAALIIVSLFAVSCEKEPQELPTPEKPQWYYFRSDKDTRTPKEGMWRGEMNYTIPGVVSQIINCNREVKYLCDSTYDMRWFSYPDTSTTVQVADSIRYTMFLDHPNNNCGNQRTVFIYTGTGYVLNDTLRESGTVTYLFYFDNILRIESVGQWSSWATWQSIIHY